MVMYWIGLPYWYAICQDIIIMHSSQNRARKSRTTLQNKVRLKVLPECSVNPIC